MNKIEEYSEDFSNKENGDEHFRSAQAEIRSTLKKGNTELSSQLEKAYQGMLKNCIKQSDDQPHKL